MWSRGIMSQFRFVWTAALMGWDAFREGRLSASPRRWLVDLRHLRRVMTRGRRVPDGHAAWLPDASVDPHGAALANARRTALAAFLHSGARLRLDTAEAPSVSVLLVLFNQADLTFRCLSSIAAHVRQPYEVVIVDNASSDDTGALLDRVDGARLLRSGRNLGFLAGANATARVARGRYLLFLNNDTELLPGAVESAVRTIEADPSVGVVGARLVLPDGTLQEAGGIIWRDGSCEGYGRGESPFAPIYAFRRDVDFCSGAFMLTPRELFDGVGGFDEAYSPAYYEDADYCVRVWQAGHRVVYDPAAIVLHHEFGSSSPGAAVAMQVERRGIFRQRHATWLAGQRPAGARHRLWARSRRGAGLRILLFDDRVPDHRAGFGLPRAADFQKALVALGHFVTLYPVAVFADAPPSRGAEITSSIEIMEGYTPRRIRTFMEERAGYYDCIIASRAHNLELLRSKLGPPGEWSPGARVIYDAEAITSMREYGRRRLVGERLDAERLAKGIENEVELARGVDAVITVSEAERQEFADRGFADVQVVSLAFSLSPTSRAFEDRHGFLFVGSFAELSPNADAVEWFTDEVLPRVRAHLASDVRLVVVGQDAPPSVRRLRERGVDVCADVTDLTPFYDRARVFVAPTRFAAGIPYKVGHAAAHGVPVVCTSLLAGQLQWQDGVHLLSADTPEAFTAACVRAYSDAALWTELRRQSLDRVAAEYSWASFRESVKSAVQPGIARSPRPRVGTFRDEPHVPTYS
jgi:O-antigen biosynthesis protein